MTKQRLGFLLAVTSMLITSSAIAQTIPSKMQVCANLSTGVITAKKRCSKGERPLSLNDIGSDVTPHTSGMSGCRRVSFSSSTTEGFVTLRADCNSSNEYLQSHGYIPLHGNGKQTLSQATYEALYFDGANPNIPTGVVVQVRNDFDDNSEPFNKFTLYVDAVCCPL